MTFADSFGAQHGKFAFTPSHRNHRCRFACKLFAKQFPLQYMLKCSV